MGPAFDLPSGDVQGFVERYDPWTGRARLQVLGPPRRGTSPRVAARIRMHDGPEYAALRRELRARYADRPFTSDWADGRFPPAPLGGPAYPVLAGAWGLGVALTTTAAVFGGGTGAWLAVLAVAWPLLRLLDTVRISPTGLQLGPPWAPQVPWHEVQQVGVVQQGGRAHVWARTDRGAARAPVPTVLVSALRGRLRRLSGLPLGGAADALELRYALWRRAAVGIPWGIFVGVAAGAWWTPWPWSVLAIGLLVVAGTALLGAAVEARASGWGTGAVGWLTLLYGLILGILSLGTLVRSLG